MSRLLAAVLAGWLALTASPVLAGDTLTAPEALSRSNAHEVVLVDLRTPVEWNDTGLAAGAAAISWGQPDFADRVLKLVKGDRHAALVLICRTGNRSGKALAALRERGFTRVQHVPEGMVGSAAGPGWIARGLPTVDWQGN